MDKFIKVTEVIHTLNDKAQKKLDEYAESVVNSVDVEDKEEDMWQRLGIANPNGTEVSEKNTPPFLTFDLRKDYDIHEVKKYIRSSLIDYFEAPSGDTEYCIVGLTEGQEIKVKESIEYLEEILVD